MPKQIWLTADGKTFDDEKAAIVHEKAFFTEEQLRQNEALDRLKKSYWYRTKGIKINPQKISTWQIYGEDPNCDMHHEPLLATVNGTFNKAMNYAVRLDRFFTWGGGGRIEEIEIHEL